MPSPSDGARDTTEPGARMLSSSTWKAEVTGCAWHATQEAGYTDRIKIGIDPASSEFFKDGAYDLNFKDPDRAGKELLSS